MNIGNLKREAIIKLYKQGVDPELIGEATGLKTTSVKQIINSTTPGRCSKTRLLENWSGLCSDAKKGMIASTNRKEPINKKLS